jgi:hypothetical protein
VKPMTHKTKHHESNDILNQIPPFLQLISIGIPFHAGSMVCSIASFAVLIHLKLHHSFSINKIPIESMLSFIIAKGSNEI